MKVVFMNTVAPSDSLQDIFTPSVMEKLRKKRDQSEELQRRLDVLGACGPMPSDVWTAREVRAWRARKAAWEAYLNAAFVAGLFERASGNDRRARLTGVDDDNFRGAVGECVAAWYLACRMGFSVSRVPEGRKDSSIDMQADLPCGTASVEVKAPFRELPPSGCTWWGDDSDKIAQCLKKAEKQFADDRPNIMVMVPMLRTPIFHDRNTLVRACFGKSVIVCDVDVSGRHDVDPDLRTEFRPSGKFLNTRKPSGSLLKQDGSPAYRRMSAILCIEETLECKCPGPYLAVLRSHANDGTLGMDWSTIERQKQKHLSSANQTWIGHEVLILHNPYALHQIPDSVFGDTVQLIPRGGVMEWTDGYECNV